MNYEEAKAMRDTIEQECRETGAVLKAYPRNSIGLVSDEIKLTLKYLQEKAAYDTAFAKLRRFNQWFVNEFKKEIQQERKARGFV